jgi:hypothetical protein
MRRAKLGWLLLRTGSRLERVLFSVRCRAEDQRGTCAVVLEFMLSGRSGRAWKGRALLRCIVFLADHMPRFMVFPDLVRRYALCYGEHARQVT